MAPQPYPPQCLVALMDKEGRNLDLVVEAATGNGVLRQTLLEGLISTDETYRYNCHKSLMQLTESHPHLIYPAWDTLTGQLDSRNAYHRITAACLLANLAAADTENHFEILFERYFDLLDDDKVIVACYAARSAWKIARAKPDLRPAILRHLLAIETTRHTQGRKDLIKADIIGSLDHIYPDAGNKEEILQFVEAQLTCTSPKTRKAAKRFLKKYQK